MNNLAVYINKLSSFKFIFLASLLAYISTIPFTLISLYFNNLHGVNLDESLPLILNIY